jgi:hypothetical protein
MNGRRVPAILLLSRPRSRHPATAELPLNVYAAFSDSMTETVRRRGGSGEAIFRRHVERRITASPNPPYASDGYRRARERRNP